MKEEDKKAQYLLDRMHSMWEKEINPKKATDYNKLFWKAGVGALIVIGANHAFAIYSNYIALRAFQEQEAERVINNTKYNDGLKYGWEMGLLRASSIMAKKGEDYKTAYDLSKDTVAYQDLIRK